MRATELQLRPPSDERSKERLRCMIAAEAFVCWVLFVGGCSPGLPGAFAGRDVRRAFIRASDRNRPETPPHAVTPSCGACGSEHAEPLPVSVRQCVGPLPSPDVAGRKRRILPQGRIRRFHGRRMARLRPFASSCRPASPFVRAGRTRCNQKRYFSCFTLSTSRWMSAQASSPKVVPTTSITLPAVMAPIVPHWRSDSPSHNPARKPAA